MVPIDLLDAVLPQTFNLLTNKQTKNTPVPVKCKKAKYNKVKYACVTRNNACNYNGKPLKFLFKEIATVGNICKSTRLNSLYLSS